MYQSTLQEIQIHVQFLTPKQGGQGEGRLVSGREVSKGSAAARKAMEQHNVGFENFGRYPIQELKEQQQIHIDVTFVWGWW